MARRKELSLSETLLGIGFLVLPAILTVIYVGSIFYVFVLIIPILYSIAYSYPTLKKNREIYAISRGSVTNSIRSLSSLRNSYSDLNITQSGNYDERSGRGKGANISIASTENALNSGLDRLKKFLSPYKTFLFLEASVWSIVISILSLCIISCDEVYIPTILVCISVLAGFAARSITSIGFSGESITPETLPQISIKRLVMVIIAWVIACLLLYLIVINKNNNVHYYFFPKDLISQTHADQTANLIDKELPDKLQNSIIPKEASDDLLNAKIDIIEIETQEKKTGFLVRDVEGLENNSMSADTKLLKNGTQVSITGKSKDMLFLEINVGSQSKRFYVPTDTVAIFE